MCIGNGDVFSITSETEDDIPGVMGGKETTETGREERRCWRGFIIFVRKNVGPAKGKSKEEALVIAEGVEQAAGDCFRR